MWTALGEEGLLLAGEGDRGSEAMGNSPACSLVGGDEAVLWCCLWSVDGERAGSVGCVGGRERVSGFFTKGREAASTGNKGPLCGFWFWEPKIPMAGWRPEMKEML
jgi:hypothetical protein